MKQVWIGVAAVAALGMSSTSSAQSVLADCSTVEWKAEVLEKYPDISKACIGVVERGGKRYVKVAGEVRRKTNDRVTVRMLNTRHDVNFTPGAGDAIYIDDKTFSAQDVVVGQSLRFYMPEDRIAVVSLDEAGTSVKEIPMAAADPEPMPEPTPAPAGEAAPAVLPSTASLLPLLGLLGLGFLGLGASLAVLRRRG